MSVLSGLSKADFKTASDGLLELSEERLRSIMRSEPITDVYHVEQTPFARSVFTLCPPEFEFGTRSFNVSRGRNTKGFNKAICFHKIHFAFETFVYAPA